MSNPPHVFYTSSNGDRWSLLRDTDRDLPYVLHRANLSSGGAETRYAIADFLNINIGSPQHTALVELVGTLADSKAEQLDGQALARLMLGTDK